MGTGGTAEINCPGVFDIMGIDYNRMEAKQFIDQLKEDLIDLEKYFYVIPVMPEMLEKSIEELNDVVVFGQSFFVVDHIENNRIIFYFPANTTWIDIDVLKKVSKDSKWVVEAEFEIYQINKAALRENRVIRKSWKKGTEKLLEENLREFGEYSIMTGTMGTVRIDGSEAYDRILHHFQNMRNYYKLLEDSKKELFCKYIYLQLLEFKKFMLSGTDAYYRNEFNLILHDLYNDISEFKDVFTRWDELELKWREFGRELNRICTYKKIITKPVECLDEIVSFWENIGSYELGLVSDTLECIYHHNISKAV